MFDSRKAAEELSEEHGWEDVIAVVDLLDELVHFADEAGKRSFEAVRDALMKLSAELID